MLRWTAATIAALLTLIIACGTPPLPGPARAQPPQGRAASGPELPH